MDSEVNLIREYERIIKTMKEQIAMLKAKVSSQRGGRDEEAIRKDAQLRVYSKQVSDLSLEVDTLTENNRKLTSELRAYEYGINKATHLTRTQMQEKLLCGPCRESELSRVRAEEEVHTLSELVREMRGDKASCDFDKDVEVYLQKKDDLNQTQNSRTAVLQRRVHALEEENKDLRDRIAMLEGEKTQILERLHALASRPSDEELAQLVTRMRGELIEKERVISELQGKPLISRQKSQLIGEIRRELGRALSPRSASLDQKMRKLQRGASAETVGSPEFMANLSKTYETMMDKYEQKARGASREGRELSVIKEKLGSTGKQLIQIVNRPTTSQPRTPHSRVTADRSHRSLRPHK